MTLLAAATVADDIVHTPLLGQVLKVAATIGTGLLTGIAIGVAAAFVVGTGGLGALVLGAVAGALIGAAADGLARAAGAQSLDEAITRPLFDAIDKVCPGVVKGQIVMGSPNVYVNGLKAARAAGKADPGFAARQATPAAAPPSWLGSVASAFADAVGGLFGMAPEPDLGFVATDEDKILCQDHPPNPEQYLAQGSSNVFINGQPAVRVSDKSTCEGKVSINPGHAARRNVSIGGDTVQVRAISTESPPWLDRISRYAGMAIGLCQALRGKGPWLGKLVCFGTNMAVSMAADAAVRGTGSYLSGRLGHPVHVPTGAKILDGEHDQDFALAARLPLDWTRRYHSGNRRAGLFGVGWMVLYDVELRLEQPDPADPEARHVFIDPQGRSIPLPALQPGEKFLAAQEGLTFAHTAGGHYMLRFADGLVIDFGACELAPGRAATLSPWALEDRSGNGHYLRHDEAGRLSGIATDCGQQLVLDYDERHGGRVSAIHQRLGTAPDSSGQRTLVRYAYDAQGQLAEVRNGQGELLRRFAYEHDARLCMQRLPQGLEVHYRWQDVMHEGEPCPRVVGWRTSTGEQVDLHYDLAADGSGGARSVDQLGRSHAWTWDALLRVTAYTDPVGGRFALTWAAQERYLQSVSNPAGGVSRFSYDERGNVAQETDPLGRQRRTRWHAELDEPLEHTAPGGAHWAWRYDAVGQLVHEQAPGGLQRSWTHDGHGAVIAHTDARGGISQYVVDPQGRLLQTTDCSARSTRYEYDAWGQLIRETDAAGQATEYRPDALGRIEGATLPDGTQQSWHWRADGLLLEHEQAGARTAYEWDGAGRLAALTDPAGSTTRWAYDTASRVTELTDGQEQRTRFEHDAAGRLIAQTGIDGLRTEYRLDACGAVVAVTQAAGTREAIRIDLQRDALGRLVGKLTPETITRYTYDAADRLVHVQRRARDYGVTLSDKPERELALIDEIEWRYDEAGRPVAETSTTHCLLQPPQPGGPASWTPLRQPRRSTVRREFDALGNPVRTVLPGGQVLGALYYGSGHLHQLSFGQRVISDIERDALHREVSRSQDVLHSEFTLDPLGRRLEVRAHAPGRPSDTPAPPVLRVRTPPAGDVVRKQYGYSPQGHLARRLDGLLGEQRLEHDAAGRVLAQTSQFHGHPLRESFSWDAASNALPGTGSHCAGRVEHNRVRVWQDIRYDYDAHGRLVAKHAGSRSSTHLRWNAEHQLIASSTDRPGVSHQTCRYHYDALGRRVAKGDGFALTWFVWDGLRMVQEQRGSHCLTTLYEGADSHVPLARVEHGCDEQEVGADQVFHFHTDLNGAPEELTSAHGRVVWRARYKTWGNTRLEEWEAAHEQDPARLEPRTQNLRFQGQYLDRETGLHYNTFRYYDPDVGRFISQDPIGLTGGIHLYRYAPNPTEWIDPLGLADDRYPNWMDTTQGYQRQHIVPYSLQEHPFFVRSGMDINGASNMMRLPVATGIDKNAKLGLHRGWTSEHAAYNRAVGVELDALERMAVKNNWDYRRVQQEVLKLQHERRAGFKTGKYTCA